MSTVRAPRRIPATRRRANPATAPAVRRPPELRVVRRESTRRVGAVTALATVVVFVMLFALAVFNTWLVQNQQRLDRLHRDVTEAQSEYERLRLEVAELESPERIVAAAVNQLGMVPPPETTYLTPSAPLVERPAPRAPTVAAGTGETADSGDEIAADDDWPTVKPYLDSTP